jgi:MFS family permease
MVDPEKENTAHVEEALEGEKLDAQLRAQVADPNIHTFRQLDPPVTPEEEKRVRWKIDRQLPPFLFLIYVITWLDRSNVGNAALMNIKTDLNLNTAGYSLAVAIFFVGACIAESVTNLGMRFVRPSVWVSSAMIIWGVIATLMAAVNNPEGLIALRFFLGFFEAALIAGAPYIFTFWYPRAEWGRRICVYLSATPFAGAFGGWIVCFPLHFTFPPGKRRQATRTERFV